MVLAQDGTLSSLLAAHPQLSADLVLPTLLTSTQLWEVMTKVFRGGERELDQLVDIFFSHVLQRVLLTRDVDVYQAVKILKARLSNRPNPYPLPSTSSTVSSSAVAGAAAVASSIGTPPSTGDGTSSSGGVRNDLNATFEKDPSSVLRLLLRDLSLPG